MNIVNKSDELKSKWEEKREILLKDNCNTDLWLEVFDDIFIERLNHYFFNPAQLLLYGSNDKTIKKSANGNGFAVIMILTSLIETIESIYSGKIYVKHNGLLKKIINNEDLTINKIDYKKVYINFFSSKEQFSSFKNQFNKKNAFL